MTETKYTAKRVVPTADGGDTLELWNSENNQWESYIVIALNDVEVDLDSLEDKTATEPYEGEGVDVVSMLDAKYLAD